MVRLIISCLFFLIQFNTIYAQQYLGENGVISFLSKAPIEDISAVNKNVAAVYDSNTLEIVFQLKIEDFIFPNKLMQDHFNESYLESDIYPNSIFEGVIIDSISNNEITIVKGNLTIHGVTKEVIVEGLLINEEKSVIIKAKFPIILEEFDIKIPKIVIYNIAEIIDVELEIVLNKI